jgi:hypothetical protein
MAFVSADSTLSVLNRDTADAFASDDQLHDARRAISDLEAHNVTHPLLMR